MKGVQTLSNPAATYVCFSWYWNLTLVCVRIHMCVC